jgi:hypothetical protein
MSNGNGVLHTLERNRFYYGKLMDVRHWETEQQYGREALQLVSRLGLGSGVLCGLGVSIAAEGCLWIEPGVAIDFHGREIVVPQRLSIQHPEQPTDCLGRADGDPVTDGEVTIALCYHECLTEPAPALQCGCDSVEHCEHGMVQEKFCVRVDRGAGDARKPFPCDTIYPALPPEGFDRRHVIFDTLTGVCPPASDDCLTLATVTFAPDKPAVVDPFTRRRVVYSNQTLFELILCLAARVDKCCGEHPHFANPPRVTRMWPRDRQVLTQVTSERDSFIKLPRLEVVFERTMAATAITNPEPWLRMWSIKKADDSVTARRVALTYKEPPGIQPVSSLGTDEQLAVYQCDARFKKELRSARVVVQLRPGDGPHRIVLDTATPPLLLDGEHHGTDLSQTQLDELWANVTNTSAGTAVEVAIWDALLGAGAPFPTGEGAEGGNLDLGFAFDVPLESAEPRLRAIWPPNAAFLRPGSDDEDERRWRSSFREAPRVEVTLDKTVDIAALEALDVNAWARVWWLRQDPETGAFAARRLETAAAGVVDPPTLPPPDDTVTVALKVDVPFPELQATRPNHFVVVLRGDAASLDADFTGFTATANEVNDLWNSDQWPGGTPTGPSSLGALLYDGDPGGTGLFFFDYADDV